jgi:hypothetical protein
MLRKSNEIGQFIFNAKTDKTKKLFNGIFSYDGHERLKIDNSQAVQNAIRKSEDTTNSDLNFNKFKVNHISFNKDKFYKFWNQNDHYDGGYLYEINDLAFSFLISNLIAHLKSDTVFSNNRLWFPVDKNLKSQRI